MNESAISRYIAESFPGVDMVRPETSDGPEIAWGDTFFIYDPNHDLDPKHRFPFATIVTKDYGTFDNASNLNRYGVFRLNIGVSKETYHSLFGDDRNVGDSANGRDFSELNRLLPHPVYGAQSWVCVLNPSDETFRHMVQPLLKEAYENVAKRHAKRH